MYYVDVLIKLYILQEKREMIKLKFFEEAVAANLHNLPLASSHVYMYTQPFIILMDCSCVGPSI